LVDGEIEFLISSDKKLAYKRYTDKDEIIVLFNLEANKQIFDLPSENYIDLITGKEFREINQIKKHGRTCVEEAVLTFYLPHEKSSL